MSLLDLLGLDDVEISLYLVGQRRSRYLNRLYRGIDKTTDVLSFAQIEDPQPSVQPSILGDIVLNLDQIKKQAIDNHVPFKDELRFMLVHGLLHLLGYDHERDRESAKKMRNKERKLLNALKELDRKCK